MKQFDALTEGGWRSTQTEFLESKTTLAGEEFQMLRLISRDSKNGGPAPAKVLGRIEYRVEPSSDEMFLAYAETTPEFRQQGVNEALLKEVLARNPQIKRITADLGTENLRIYHDTYNQLPETLKKFHPEQAVQLALEQTPAYKIRKKLGFSKIIFFGRPQENWDPLIKFIVERE